MRSLCCPKLHRAAAPSISLLLSPSRNTHTKLLNRFVKIALDQRLHIRHGEGECGKTNQQG